MSSATKPAPWWQRRVMQPLIQQLRQGATPEKLALSLALGITIGLVPVLGVSTALCAAAALALRLNMPAMQLVNYLLTPVQLLLIIPFLRLGEFITGAERFPITLESGLSLLSRGVLHAVAVLWTAILHASLAWLLVAPLVVLILHRSLTPALRYLRPASLETP